MAKEKKPYQSKRYLYYWLSLLIGYVFPFTYFFIRVGATKSSTTVVLPTLFALIFLIVKVTGDINSWVATWQPSFKKGLVKAIPKLLLFIILISLGLSLKVVLEHQVKVAMYRYFESVLVIFGAQALSAIVGAVHLKYKEQDLISKGYVMGVVNR